MSEPNIVSANEPIRIALVGCGRISKNHFDVISRLDDLKLVAVCDNIDERHVLISVYTSRRSKETVDEWSEHNIGIATN